MINKCANNKLPHARILVELKTLFGTYSMIYMFALLQNNDGHATFTHSLCNIWSPRNMSLNM